jgi:hypothetical protein
VCWGSDVCVREMQWMLWGEGYPEFRSIFRFQRILGV